MKTKLKEFTPEERALICNGCGSRQLRRDFNRIPIIGPILRAVNWLLRWACERHDFRYGRGHKGRWLADLLLLLEGLACILIAFCICIIAVPVLIIYYVILVFTGWYTYTIYNLDGTRMTEYSTRKQMLKRAQMRRVEMNPQASDNEKAQYERDHD